jgi:hypothetical protein
VAAQVALFLLRSQAGEAVVEQAAQVASGLLLAGLADCLLRRQMARADKE